MRQVHDAYKAHLGDQLPVILRMKPDFSAPEQNIISIDSTTHSWMGKEFATGLITDKVRGIIAKICNYQQERNSRQFGGGFANDPTNLVCEEIKEWLVTICRAIPSPEFLEKIDKRILYVDRLIKYSVFPMVSVHETTMQMVLLQVRRTLEEIRTVIDRKIVASSAEELFGNLFNHLQRVLGSGVVYLCYIFRDNPDVDARVTIEDFFQRDQNLPKEIRKIIHTISGNCLQQLVNSQPIVNVYTLSPQRVTTALQTYNLQENNPFLNAYGFPVVRYQNQELNPMDCLNQNNSGIDKTFLGRCDLMSSFIRLHGLLYELAVLTLLCKQVKDLAGLGGDIIICGAANEKVNALLDYFLVLIKEIWNYLYLLNESADSYFDQLVMQRQGSTVWQRNFRFVMQERLILEDQLAQCSNLVAMIRHHTNRRTVGELIQEGREKMMDFLENISLFSQHMVGLFPSASIKQFSRPSPSLLQQCERRNMDATLDLVGRNIGDNCIKQLVIMPLQAGSTNYTVLNLENNHITGVGARLIIENLVTHCPDIKVLNLTRNQIGDDGAEFLSRILPVIPLHTLGINDNGITKIGARILASGLIGNCSLVYLDIGYNQLGDEGVIAIAEALKVNNTLVTLCLYGNNVTERSIITLLDMLKENTTITGIKFDLQERDIFPRDMFNELENRLQRQQF